MQKSLLRFSFLIPSLLIIFILTYIPLIYSIVLSFFERQNDKLVYCGLSHYLNLLKDDTYVIVLKNSFIFSLLIVPLIIIISLLLALCIHNLKTDKLQNIFITLFYIPCITSPVAYSLFFKQISYSDGVLSNFLKKLVLLPDSFNILSNIWTARMLLIFVCLWAWVGYYVLILFSAIKNIDLDVYRIAYIDGVSKSKIFLKVVLPGIKPVIILVSLLACTSSFQLYVESSIITKGGPSQSTYTIVHYLYKRAFLYVSDYGYVSAMSVSIFILCSFFCIFIFILSSKHEKKQLF